MNHPLTSILNHYTTGQHINQHSPSKTEGKPSWNQLLTSRVRLQLEVSLFRGHTARKLLKKLTCSAGHGARFAITEYQNVDWPPLIRLALRAFDHTSSAAKSRSRWTLSWLIHYQICRIAWGHRSSNSKPQSNQFCIKQTSGWSVYKAVESPCSISNHHNWKTCERVSCTADNENRWYIGQVTLSIRISHVIALYVGIRMSFLLESIWICDDRNLFIE